jgi:hypothetical protein
MTYGEIHDRARKWDMLILVPPGSLSGKRYKTETFSLPLSLKLEWT